MLSIDLAKSCALILAMSSGVALAQSNASATDTEPKTLSKIRVQESVDDEKGYAPRRSGTATKTDTPLLETPQAITVVTAEQIRDQSSPNLQEALRYTAGVRNELYGVDNRGDCRCPVGGASFAPSRMRTSASKCCGGRRRSLPERTIQVAS